MGNSNSVDADFGMETSLPVPKERTKGPTGAAALSPRTHNALGLRAPASVGGFLRSYSSVNDVGDTLSQSLPGHPYLQLQITKSSLGLDAYQLPAGWCVDLVPRLKLHCRTDQRTDTSEYTMAVSDVELLILSGSPAHLGSDPEHMGRCLTKIALGIIERLQGAEQGGVVHVAPLQKLLVDIFQVSVKQRMWTLAQLILHNRSWGSTANGDDRHFLLVPCFGILRAELDFVEFEQGGVSLLQDVKLNLFSNSARQQNRVTWAEADYGKCYDMQEDARHHLLALLNPVNDVLVTNRWYKCLEAVYRIKAITESSAVELHSDVELYALSRMALHKKLVMPLEVLLVAICERLSAPPLLPSDIMGHALLPLPDLLDGTFLCELSVLFPVLACQLLEKVPLGLLALTCHTPLPWNMAGVDEVQAFARLQRDRRQPEAMIKEQTQNLGAAQLSDSGFVAYRAVVDCVADIFTSTSLQQTWLRNQRLIFEQAAHVARSVVTCYAVSFALPQALLALLSPLALGIVLLALLLPPAAVITGVMLVQRLIGKQQAHHGAKKHFISWRLIPVRGLAQIRARDLLGPLINAPDVAASAFSTPTVKAFILFKWNNFFKYFMFMQLLDHLLYSTLFIVYAIGLGDLQAGSLDSGARKWSAEAGLRHSTEHARCLSLYQYRLLCTLLVMTAGYVMQEVSQAVRLWHWTWTTATALLNPMYRVPSIILVTTVSMYHLRSGCHANIELLRCLAAAEVLILFCRLLYYLMAYRRLGSFVRMVIEVGRSLTYFFVVLAVVFVGFCLAYMVLLGAATDSQASLLFGVEFTKIFGFDYAFFHDDSKAAASEHGVVVMYMVIKALFQVVVFIILLNLIIAIIGDTHDNIRMNEGHQSYRNLAVHIVAMESLIPRPVIYKFTENLTHGKEGANMFMMVVDKLVVKKLKQVPPPVDDSLIEPNEWSGRMAEIKKIQETTVERVRAEMSLQQPRLAEMEDRLAQHWKVTMTEMRVEHATNLDNMEKRLATAHQEKLELMELQHRQTADLIRLLLTGRVPC